MAGTSSSPVASEARIFVGQIAPTVTEEQLWPIFTPFGPVRSIHLLKNNAGGDHGASKSRGCAMVLFTKWAHAESAAEELDGKYLPLGQGDKAGSQTRPLVVHFANPRRAPPGQPAETGIAPRKLFVGQVPRDVTEADLRPLFQQYGDIEHVNILRTQRGQSAGCAFVQFRKWAQAEAAMEAHNGKTRIGTAEVPLVVKFADAKRKEAPVPHQGLPLHMQSPEWLAHLRRAQFAGLDPHHFQAAGLGLMNPGLANMNGFGGGGGELGLADEAAFINSMAMSGLAGQQQGRRGYGLLDGSGGLSNGLGGPGGGGGEGPLGLGQQGLGLPGGYGHMGMNGLGGLPGPDFQHALAGVDGAGINALSARLQKAGLGDGGLNGHMGGPPGAHGHPHHAWGQKIGSSDKYNEWKLFIGQVPLEYTEDRLFEHFGALGDILELYILRNSNGKSRGCAFVTYTSKQLAQKAITALNGKQIGGKTLVVKFADRAVGTKPTNGAVAAAAAAAAVANGGPHPPPASAAYAFAGANGELVQGVSFPQGVPQGVPAPPGAALPPQPPAAAAAAAAALQAPVSAAFYQ